MIPHSTSLEELIRELSTDVSTGLAPDQTQELLQKFGENKLKAKKKKTNVQRFFDQFKDVMILILILAAAISFVVALYEKEAGGFFEPGLILLIVVLNAMMGVVQESKAEKALEALENLSAPQVRVIRNGKEAVIDASQLVPGDIINLAAGDFVPADARIIQSASLKSEESALTGESLPSEKEADALVVENVPLGDRFNMLYAGCSITYGHGKAVVTETACTYLLWG